jgi:acid phosphatase
MNSINASTFSSRKNRGLRKSWKAFGSAFGLAATQCIAASINTSALPTPDHVLIVILENHGAGSVLGSANAPYINALAGDSQAAVFAQSYALTHPSQPNYLMLFSGSAQGVTDDNVPSALPFTTPNLGAALLTRGLAFIAYSEDLPSVGFTGATSKGYARKHAPWVNWQGGGKNGFSAGTHHPMADFPADFASLPAVTYVVPNLDDDMHDGTVAQGDAWLKAHLDAYVKWARAHNSLFILTFDEDESAGGSNQIPTLFLGPMVKPGKYPERISHYNVLRTLGDFYGAAPSGAADTAKPILDVWRVTTKIRGCLPGSCARPGKEAVRYSGFSELSWMEWGDAGTARFRSLLGRRVTGPGQI